MSNPSPPNPSPPNPSLLDLIKPMLEKYGWNGDPKLRGEFSVFKVYGTVWCKAGRDAIGVLDNSVIIKWKPRTDIHASSPDFLEQLERHLNAK